MHGPSGFWWLDGSGAGLKVTESTGSGTKNILGSRETIL